MIQKSLPNLIMMTPMMALLNMVIKFHFVGKYALAL